MELPIAQYSELVNKVDSGMQYSVDRLRFDTMQLIQIIR